MTRHKTPHWTDGDGIGKKLVGEELQHRLDELSNQANAHHQNAQDAWQGMIQHARDAGEALLEAKRRMGHRSKWSKWRKKYFNGSKETSCDYMRVAREWDNPLIVEARSAGIAIESISKFLKVLRGQPLTSKAKEKSKSEEERDALQQTLRRNFAAKVRDLTDAELEILAYSDWDGSLKTFDELWAKLHDQLKTGVAILYGEELTRKEEEEKRMVRRSVNIKLNRTRGDVAELTQEEKKSVRRKATKAINERARYRKIEESQSLRTSVADTCRSIR